MLDYIVHEVGCVLVSRESEMKGWRLVKRAAARHGQLPRLAWRGMRCDVLARIVRTSDGTRHEYTRWADRQRAKKRKS